MEEARRPLGQETCPHAETKKTVARMTEGAVRQGEDRADYWNVMVVEVEKERW